MQEFKDYWDSEEGEKVKQAMKQQRQDDFTVMGLRANLETMSAYLIEHHLGHHIPLFKCVTRDVVMGGIIYHILLLPRSWADLFHHHPRHP